MRIPQSNFLLANSFSKQMISNSSQKAMFFAVMETKCYCTHLKKTMIVDDDDNDDDRPTDRVCNDG